MKKSLLMLMIIGWLTACVTTQYTQEIAVTKTMELFENDNNSDFFIYWLDKKAGEADSIKNIRKAILSAQESGAIIAISGENSKEVARLIVLALEEVSSPLDNVRLVFIGATSDVQFAEKIMLTKQGKFYSIQ